MLDQPQNATNIDISLVRAIFEPNLFGLIQTTTTLLPLIRKSAQGAILNVSSGLASSTNHAKPDSTLRKFTAYNASKTAANSYTIALAHELRKEGIKVNCVSPGLTATRMSAIFGATGKSAKDGAESLLPWALLGADGPTGKF